MAAAKAFTPGNVRTNGGQVNGDTAWIAFTGHMDGKPVPGTAHANRVDGVWYAGDIAVKEPR